MFQKTIFLSGVLFLLLIGCKKEEQALFPVSKNGKYGFINKKGKIVIEPKFDYAWKFREGLAMVGKTNRYGCVNKKGDIVIPIKFDRLGWQFSEGRMQFYKEVKQRWGFINKKGEIVIEARFNYAYDFSDGLAKVKVGDRWGYIDTLGKYIWEPTK